MGYFSSSFALFVSLASYYYYNLFSSINPLYPFSILSPISLLRNFNSLIFCLVFRFFSLRSMILQSCSLFPLPTADILRYKRSDYPRSLQIRAQLFSISLSRISLLRSFKFICLDFFKGFALELPFKFRSSSVYQLLRALSSLMIYCCSCSIAGVESKRYPVLRVIHSQRCRQVVYSITGLLALFEGNCNFGSYRQDLSRAVMERLFSRDVIHFEIIQFKCNRISPEAYIQSGLCQGYMLNKLKKTFSHTFVQILNQKQENQWLLGLVPSTYRFFDAFGNFILIPQNFSSIFTWQPNREVCVSPKARSNRSSSSSLGGVSLLQISQGMMT